MSVSGMRGRRMDFSWTWKEKRKKERDEMKRAMGRRWIFAGGDGDSARPDLVVVPFELIVGVVVGCRRESAECMRMMTVGMRAIRVVNVAS